MSTLATWFTPSLSAVSRSKGSSSVASAAYRACQKLYDKFHDAVHDYRPKRGQIVTEIFGEYSSTIEDLWNTAEASEKRKDARTAREIMIPLPSEWDSEQHKEYCVAVSQMLYEQYKVAGQFSIHAPDKKNNNHHVHILFTTREVSNNQFGKKTRILDEGKTNGEVTKLRKRIADLMNNFSEKFGSDFFVTGGKFQEFDENHIPTKNIPINATPELRAALEEENRQIIEMRGKLKKVNGDIKNTETEIQAAIASYEENKEQTRVKKKRLSKSVENLSQNVEKSLPAVAENVSPVPDEIEHTIIEKSVFIPYENLSPAPVEISKPVLDENVSKKEEVKAPIVEPNDILNEAFNLKRIFESSQKAKENYKKNSSKIDRLREQIAELENYKNNFWESAIDFCYPLLEKAFTVNNPIAEREIMKKNLIADIERLSARQVELKSYIYKPHIVKGCITWECDLSYQKAIEEFSKQSPDYKKPAKEPKKIEPVYEVDFSGGLEHVNNPSHTDYSNHPYHIKAPWENGPKPPGYD